MSATTSVEPAARYARGSGDICVVACYFNPAGYATKPANLRQFAEPLLEAAIPLFVAECAFGSGAFELNGMGTTMRVRATDILWLKERLLNQVIESLPRRYTKVVWVDADVLFENASWLRETERLLDEVPVVQPFQVAYRLPPGSSSYAGVGHLWPSFARRWEENGRGIFSGGFNHHGHTGFAWAARREILAAHGLYDACIAGGGDHVMAHVMCGDWSSACFTRALGGSRAMLRHCERWALPMFAAVRGRVRSVPGAVLHLWHGDYSERQYDKRGYDLAQLGFDPSTDLQGRNTSCWRLRPDRPELRRWARSYFAERKEDGPSLEADRAETRRGVHVVQARRAL